MVSGPSNTDYSGSAHADIDIKLSIFNLNSFPGYKVFYIFHTLRPTIFTYIKMHTAQMLHEGKTKNKYFQIYNIHKEVDKNKSF